MAAQQLDTNIISVKEAHSVGIANMSEGSESEASPAGGTHNVVAGDAVQVAVQARDIHIQGGLHVHAQRVSLPLPQMLPPNTAHFTGRDSELDRLDALLDTDASAQPAAVVISAITGSAGIGKTALALHWAHRVQDRFPDGQLYVNLRGHDPGPPVVPGQALDSFLRVLNVSGEDIPRTVDAMAGLYRSLVAGRRMLVVLDNAATPEQVRPLLPASPSCMVLITSRSRLSGLVARDGALRITLDLLSPAEAITLLRTIIGSDRADHDPEATVELARRCTYLPLALRIAAERIVARPRVRVADLVNDLSIEQNQLDLLAADDDVSTTVRGVFSWSYRALTRPAARVFRLLSLHPGADISEPAAAALTGTSRATVRGQLDLLTGVHLLEQADRDRYRFHDLIRAYAAESVAAEESPEDRADGERRILDWYLHTGVAARHTLYPQLHALPVGTPPDGCQPLTFTDRSDAVQWYDAEHDNLVAAIHHAADNCYDAITWQLPAVIAPFLILRSRWADQISVQQTAVAAAQRIGDKQGEFWSFLTLGEAHYLHLDRYDEAVSYLFQAMEAAQQIEDKWGQGSVYSDLGELALKRNQFEEAIAYLQRGLPLLLECNDKRGHAVTLIYLATAYRHQRQFAEALDTARQALTIFQSQNNRWKEALGLSTIGAIYRDCQEPDKAVSYLQDALIAYREVDDHHGTAETLNDLGEAFLQAGNVSHARAAWREALIVFDKLGSPWSTRVHAHLSALDETSIRQPD